MFEDEASFRQDSTLYRTWSRRGQTPLVPVTGARKSVKIFACVEVYSGAFLYRDDEVFNAATYLSFLEEDFARTYHRRGQRVLYIHDNASYHKDIQVTAWFEANRPWLEVYRLPPYSPELNAAESLWHHTRVHGSHNTYFRTTDEILSSIGTVFRSIQKEPRQIMGYLRPFQ